MNTNYFVPEGFLIKHLISRINPRTDQNTVGQTAHMF